MKDMFELGREIGIGAGRATHVLMKNMDAITEGLDGVKKVAKAYGDYLMEGVKDSFSFRYNIAFAKSWWKYGVSHTYSEIMRGIFEGINAAYAESFEEDEILDEEHASH